MSEKAGTLREKKARKKEGKKRGNERRRDFEAKPNYKKHFEKPNERFELPTYRLLSGCSAN